MAFFFGLHQFFDGKRVTPCNPALGATIPSNVSGLRADAEICLSLKTFATWRISLAQ